jgi:hypothetical protein
MSDEAAPDPLDGWMTMLEASRLAGCTRQNLYLAARGGRLKVRQLGNRIYLVHRDELLRWAAKRPAASANLFGLSPRMAQVLVGTYQQRRQSDYPHFVTTARALTRRGLLEAGDARRLSEKGANVARELIRLGC